MLWNALSTFILCGVIGVLIDIDHPISYYLIPEWSGRFLHAPILIVSILVICSLGAYVCRLRLA